MRKKLIQVFFVIISGLFLSGSIWFWKDDDGVRHFSNVSRPVDKQVGQLEESRKVYKKLKSNKQYQFTVVRVYDGDTVQVAGLGLKFTVRMAGIDTPEIGYEGRPDQPFSQMAKRYLNRILERKKVSIKSYGTGGYNRQLAEIFLEGRNINLEMIISGMAEVYQGRLPKTLNSKAYFDAQSTAKKAKRGVWAQGRSYRSPKLWRKEHPRK